MLKAIISLVTLILLGTTVYFNTGSSSSSATSFRGSWFSSCPNPKVVENFSTQDYLGIWYEQRRMNSLPFEKGDCGKVKYGLKEDGKLSVMNTGYIFSEGKYEEAAGEARKYDESGNGRL